MADSSNDSFIKFTGERAAHIQNLGSLAESLGMDKICFAAAEIVFIDLVAREDQATLAKLHAIQERHAAVFKSAVLKDVTAMLGNRIASEAEMNHRYEVGLATGANAEVYDPETNRWVGPRELYPYNFMDDTPPASPITDEADEPPTVGQPKLETALQIADVDLDDVFAPRGNEDNADDGPCGNR